ncbi:hypothetical protein [Methanolobus sp.]|uniref:hypothetical protein n=1 Tax=Methanolobus sp. TaxID=1874737 RepID=UPI0025FFEC74|nr:hypothetical protein [Methanolobus sp.]
MTRKNEYYITIPKEIADRMQAERGTTSKSEYITWIMQYFYDMRDAGMYIQRDVIAKKIIFDCITTHNMYISNPEILSPMLQARVCGHCEWKISECLRGNMQGWSREKNIMYGPYDTILWIENEDE